MKTKRTLCNAETSPVRDVKTVFRGVKLGAGCYPLTCRMLSMAWTPRSRFRPPHRMQSTQDTMPGRVTGSNICVGAGTDKGRCITDSVQPALTKEPQKEGEQNLLSGLLNISWSVTVHKNHYSKCGTAEPNGWIEVTSHEYTAFECSVLQNTMVLRKEKRVAAIRLAYFIPEDKMIYVLRKQRRARAAEGEWGKQGALPWRRRRWRCGGSDWPESSSLSRGAVARTTGSFCGATEGESGNRGAIWLCKAISDHQEYITLKPLLSHLYFSYIFFFTFT